MRYGEWEGEPAESAPGGFEKDPGPDGQMVEMVELRRKIVPFDQLVETVCALNVSLISSQPGRDRSTGWRCHSAGAGGASQY